ncbi:MAG: histone deacetylase, partial [Gemmatimonadales bacterium]
MRAWSSARFGIPLPADRRFPIAKYALVRQAVVASGVLPPEAIHEPDPADRAVLTLAHSESYVDAVIEGRLTEDETRRLGFPFNDAAVAIRALRQWGRIRRAVVIDLDVHQGNGTARIFAGDPAVFTYSMHGERNYPIRKESSRLDVGLPDGCDDAQYLGALERHLE